MIDLPIAADQEYLIVSRTTQQDTDISRRLREALAHRGISARELSRRIGVGETPVGRILNGEASPNVTTLKDICTELRVRPTYVFYGEGPRYNEDPEESTAVKRAPTLGIERWLQETSEGRGVTDDERAWLLAVPWVAPHQRQSDAVYQLILLGYRQMARSSSSTTLEPVATGETKRVG